MPRGRQEKLLAIREDVPFCVGIVMARGQMKVSDFSTATLNDPQVLAAARKVVPVEDASFDWKFKLPDGRVEILTRDGRRLDRVGSNVPGSPEVPLSWNDIAAKFADCAGAAAKPVPADRIEKATQMARHLDALEDATELLRVLAPSV